MTISTTTSRASYNGNGVTTVFSVPFRFFASSDLVVELVTTSTGASTTLTLTTHYTVTGADEEAGGSLTMLTAPAVGERLVIRRVITATQEVDYISGESFPAETHERALDRLTMLSQQNDEVQDRSLTVPVADAAFDTELPPISAAKYLRVNAAGDKFELVSAVDPGTLVVSPFIETLLDDTDADAAQTTLGGTTVGKALFTAADAAAARLAVGVPNSGPLSGLRNLVINGNFSVNQRGYTSGTATTGANQYTLDRWRVVTSGQSLTYITSGAGRTVTAPAGGIEQVIEGASVYGGTYVINWTGTATCTVGGTARAKGDTFTLTGGSNATVRFVGGTVGDVQIEPGSVVTAFEMRPAAIELEMCRRYFQVLSLDRRLYATASATDLRSINFQTMRATPTLSAISGASNLNLSSNTATATSASSLRHSVVATVTGDAYTIDGTVTLSAEL